MGGLVGMYRSGCGSGPGRYGEKCRGGVSGHCGGGAGAWKMEGGGRKGGQLSRLMVKM